MLENEMWMIIGCCIMHADGRDAQYVSCACSKWNTGSEAGHGNAALHAASSRKLKEHSMVVRCRWCRGDERGKDDKSNKSSP